MTNMVSVPANTPKTVSFVLTIGIETWLKAEAHRRGISTSAMARLAIEKAMKEAVELHPEMKER